jgi:hypothetical protein
MRRHGRDADAFSASDPADPARHSRDAADPAPAMTVLTRRGFLAALAVAPAVGAASLPKLTVTKDPTCSCCAGWTEHVRAAGFPVDVVETNELNRVKVRLGVPSHLAACHTGEVDGYVIEGHVPAATIKRLLAERPAVKGLAVRGMPIGSPGMEVEGAEPETYDVIAFGPSGETRYARYKGAEPV